MASFNKVILVGNLTRDPEIRVTPKGTSICQFGLAVNRKFKDESGAPRDETTFIDVEAWGKTGELIGKYLRKGSSCLAEGRLRLDQWEDKGSGQKRSKLKVVAENVQFLGSPKGDMPNSQADDGDTQHYSAQPMQRGQSAPQPANHAVDENVPF